jgi:hypothetical protein
VLIHHRHEQAEAAAERKAEAQAKKEAQAEAKVRLPMDHTFCDPSLVSVRHTICHTFL